MSVAVTPAPSRLRHDYTAIATRSQKPSATHSPRIRSLFLSDLHLGFRHAQADALLTFLNTQRPDYLYLIGDFIDGWCLGRRWCWHSACSDVIARVMELARSGTQVRLAVGNHDALLRHPLVQHLMMETGLCQVAEEYQHELADGRRFLILHGDRFDSCERLHPLASWGIEQLYELLLRSNHLWSKLTRSVPHGPRSFTGRLKNFLGISAGHLRRIRELIIRHARWRGCHGVICGHIHEPMTLDVHGITYCNTGDWVENCTALVEDSEGRLRLIWPTVAS
ncbi:MAG: UDP-2,3-diacylglucosamine diphosphatase [Planctomycetaceae bacterium]